MKATVLFFLLLIPEFSSAQDTTGARVQLILRINDSVEQALLERNSAALDTLFGDDLLFSHGGGNVDNKKLYLARVPKSFYASRMTDSTRVELHDQSALVLGVIRVHNGGDNPKPSYAIRYIRLFALRNDRWVLVSHRTLQKWNEQ